MSRARWLVFPCTYRYGRVTRSDRYGGELREKIRISIHVIHTKNPTPRKGADGLPMRHAQNDGTKGTRSCATLQVPQLTGKLTAVFCGTILPYHLRDRIKPVVLRQATRSGDWISAVSDNKRRNLAKLGWQEAETTEL